MTRKTDVCPVGAELYFLPVETRMPLKFGPEVLTSVTCARARVRVADAEGRMADGWGETPLSVQWVWPSELSYDERHEALKQFCLMLCDAWATFDQSGHPLEVGCAFVDSRLPELHAKINATRAGRDPMPWLAALVACSAFDIALHDAYGKLHGAPIYETYTRQYMNNDLARYLVPAEGAEVSFAGKYPCDFLVKDVPTRLPAWHVVAGLDPLTEDELTGSEPDDGYPVVLADWIRRDGLKCLKVKVTGTDAVWDYDRLVKMGRIGIDHGVEWLMPDFNCTVTEPEYVNAVLDRLMRENPRVYQMILFVEQPFPYDLERHRIDVHSVSARKPVCMDESAHDWKLVRLGRQLGWSGVALKTCKTQSGALLTACWAKAHGMPLFVADLTNPMLAQISHVQLAAHVGTIMGVGTNAMQFYPEASNAEAVVHPGLYQRRDGCVDLSTISGPGFGYRLDEIRRKLPAPSRTAGEVGLSKGD